MGVGRVNPKIGFRTRFWYRFFAIGTNIGLCGLKLSAFMHSLFETIPMEALWKAPDPLFDSNTMPEFPDLLDF